MKDNRPLLILGAAGQVGRAVTVLAAARALPVRAVTRAEADIADEMAMSREIADASFVVNCAAYTAVDKAESEPDAAYAVNAEAPGRLARLCQEAGVPLLHISTDYVFGEPVGRPWREDDTRAPLNVYGASKAAGEDAVRAALDRHLILRTAWVYDSEGKNFVLTMLRLGKDRPELGVVGDQWGGPTSARDIARAMLTMVETASAPGFTAWGTYHFAGAPATTWYDFAVAIFAGRGGPKLKRLATADYPTPARRPPYSVLDCGRIAQVFGIAQPDWRASLDKVLEAVASRG